MNRQQAALLMEKIRSRAQAFHQATGTKREFRAQASGTTTAVYLYDYIGGWDGISAKDVVDCLAGITGDIDLHINSGGGDIFEGTAIYNAFRNYGNGTVRSYVDGIAASAASFVAMAGSEVVMEEGSTLMVHDGWGFTIGNEEDHLEAAGVLGMLSTNIAEMYAKKTGGKAEDWRTVMRGEKWYTAQQAVDAGLADRLASGGAAAENKFDLSVFNYARPSAPAPVAQTETFDLEGLRNALKGAFA